MNKNDEAPTIDRQALAEQVIVSAGNILVAAGFAPREIGFFFRQAADQLDPVSPIPPAASDLGHGGLDHFQSAFAQSAPVSELRRLAAQGKALLPLSGEGPALKDCFDLTMRMAPLLAEAQNGLRALAEQAGVPLFANRGEWMRGAASSTAASDAQPALCLEDFETAYPGAFEVIGAVADELLRRQDGEAFAFLLGHLAENGVVISQGLHASIEKGMQLLRA